MTPPTTEPLAGRTVTLGGLAFTSVTGDPAAFVVAASCSGSVTSVATVSAITLTGSTSFALTVDGSGGSSVGSQRICVRWSSTQPYSDAIGLIIGACVCDGRTCPADCSPCRVVSRDSAVLCLVRFAGNATSFSPTVMSASSPSSLVLTGSGLDNATTQVRLEAGSTCTSTGGGTLLNGTLSGGGTTLTVGLGTNGTTAVASGGIFSVCVRFSSLGTASFFKVGSTNLAVSCVRPSRACSAVFFFLVLTSPRVSHNPHDSHSRSDELHADKHRL